MTFRTYDEAYIMYYEIEYLVAPDGKISFISYIYPEDADGPMDYSLIWTDYQTGVQCNLEEAGDWDNRVIKPSFDC